MVGLVAREEVEGLSDQPVVVVRRDLAGAGRAAALDLVEQAGPGAADELAVRAVAQQERLFQLVQSAVDCAGAGEGAEVVALFLLRAAMLLDLGKSVVATDEDIGEGFVVAQQHVVLGLELLDQVLFEQQRLGLGPRGEKHHRRGF